MLRPFKIGSPIYIIIFSHDVALCVNWQIKLFSKKI